MKLKVYDGAKPNTKQIRIRTNGYEKYDLTFIYRILMKVYEVQDAGHKIDWDIDKAEKAIREMLQEVKP